VGQTFLSALPNMMAIDIERILRETFIVRAEYHPTIGSTNDRAAECAAHGTLELPLLIAAGQQTAGRGRAGNRWWTGRGALAVSLLVDGQAVGADTGFTPLLALATAVAVVDAVAPLLPAHPLAIRWPNDVLAADRKLAGILVEVLPHRQHVIGVGINSNNVLADAPAELQATTSTLCELTGRQHDQTDLLVKLIQCLEKQFLCLRREPQTIAARVDALCLQRGRMLTLQWANRTITGRCRGVAADGAILLETPAGVEPFYSGIVSALPRECPT
jgi:BirA family transcriptional regulator, biotin operon repressor / biotin---[acetyl-CoA-carboxylase] ligase